MVNELGIYDAEYLKKGTNAPYLVAEDGHYVRDGATEKPLVWDAGEGTAKVYDDETIQDDALKGSYEVEGKQCRPAFELFKEHLKKYPADKVGEITGIPEETVRRFAKEFAEAAQVGKTIQYEGHTLPHRPACIETKRGGTQHKNGFWNVYSIILPNILVGAMNVPGGLLGTHPQGPFGMWKITESKDGLIVTDVCDVMGDITDFITPYPPEEVKPPESLELMELIPCSGFRNSMPIMSLNDPAKVGIPYDPEFLVIFRFNPMMSMMDPKTVGETLKKMKFILSFAWQIDETNEFADLVIPEAHDSNNGGCFLRTSLPGSSARARGPGTARYTSPSWTLRRGCVTGPNS